jgi:hypothetical protein
MIELCVDSSVMNGLRGEKPTAKANPEPEIKVDKEDTKEQAAIDDLDLLCELIYDEICYEIVSSEYVGPSVPDCILEFVKDLAAETL